MAKPKLMKGLSCITKKGVEYWYARILASTGFFNQFSDILHESNAARKSISC